MSDVKTFDLKKFIFTRIPASGEQWGKLIDFAWKLCVVLFIWSFVIAPIKDRFFPKKQTPVSIESVSGGSVDASSNKRVKSGLNLLNFG